MTNPTPQPSATMQNVGESRKVIAIQVNLREINALIDRLIESVHDQWENSGQLESELKSVVSRLAEHAEGRMPTPQPSDVGEVEAMLTEFCMRSQDYARAPMLDSSKELDACDEVRLRILAAVRTLAAKADAKENSRDRWESLYNAAKEDYAKVCQQLTDAQARVAALKEALESVSLSIACGDLLVSDEASDSGRHEHLKRQVQTALAGAGEGKG
jgi:hypothetical protein